MHQTLTLSIIKTFIAVAWMRTRGLNLLPKGLSAAYGMVM